MITRIFHFAFMAAVGTVMPLAAQERAAGGVNDTQAAWQSLAAMAASAEGLTGRVHTRLGSTADCGKVNKFYAPGKTGADAQGCMARDTVLLDRIISCNERKMFYSSTTGDCIAPR